jgi:hypothetical protein
MSGSPGDDAVRVRGGGKRKLGLPFVLAFPSLLSFMLMEGMSGEGDGDGNGKSTSLSSSSLLTFRRCIVRCWVSRLSEVCRETGSAGAMPVTFVNVPLGPFVV